MNNSTLPALVSVFLCFLSATSSQEVKFTVVGCGPYKPQEEIDLLRDMARENALGESEFMVHLGDIMSGSTPATRDRYTLVASILKKLEMTTFIVVGDNEWNDKQDPDQAWRYWERYFMGFEKHWTKKRSLRRPYPTIRAVMHQQVRPENFAFMRKGVLFIGINLPGGRVHDAQEWETRHGQNAEWVRTNLEFFRNSVRAAVVFAQARPAAKHDSFFVPFRAAAAEFSKPVLYIHADGHHWQEVRPWPEQNILRVQTDQIGITPPVLVTVKEEGEELFEFDRRYIRGPYLAMGLPEQMTIVWRYAGAIRPVVRYGDSPNALGRVIQGADILVKSADAKDEALKLHSEREGTAQYEATIKNLAPGRLYYYGVYNGKRLIAGADREHYFVTAPAHGSKRPFRFWVVGDSGTGGQKQAEVHNAMRRFTGRHPIDFYMHVGDMAYGSGTDWEFQHHFFEPYSDTLRNTVCWPTMGNHEGNTSDGKTGIGPYYDCYVLPANGEAGGVPSGTEVYYSFNYGNAHFVCLNSHDLERQSTGAMARWLKSDLEQADSDWLIAFWHHPPYTKGSHDSDLEQQLIEMREHIMPILESSGVDMVLTGHSHIYERSMLVDGAYATPTVSTNVILDDAEATYRKSEGLNAHEGTIQVVTGHGGTGLRRKATMPIMRKTIVEHGSVIVDIDGDTLSAVMLNSKGEKRDLFSIVKRGTVLQERMENPWQPKQYVNYRYIVASASLKEIVKPGAATSAEFKIRALPVGGVQAVVEWNTKGTSWNIDPPTAELELKKDEPTVTSFQVSYSKHLFPLAKLKLTFKTDKGDVAGKSGLVLPPYKKLTLRRMKSPPKIDGIISDQEKAGLEKQGDMIEYKGTGPSKYPTDFYVGLSGNQLYVACINHEPQMDQIKIVERKRDGGNWKDDCNEVFIMREGSKEYYQIIVSASGSVYDAINGWTSDSIDWNTKVQNAVKLGKDRWIVEQLIDLSMLGELKSGDVLRFNLCRNLPVHRELSQWSHTNRKSNHRPEYFGTAVVE